MPPHWLWGYLLPIGSLLLIWGGLPPRKARRITPLAALSLALATLGYWAVGFALHLGGAHAIDPDLSLSGLDRLLAPGGSGWGLMGLAGFFLSDPAMTPRVFALFLSYLPLISTAVLWVVLALADTKGWLMVLVGALTGALIVPPAACWMWGSGWLAHLGTTMNLGHGFVDFGGSALLLWVPGTVALGVLLWQPRAELEENPTLPPAYFPLLANVGALLIGVGWIGWAVSGPFHTFGATWDWNRAALNVLLGMSGAVLTSQLYGWLVTGEIDPLLAARGMMAGWGAILAGAPFIPPWAAVVIGLLAGLFFPLLLYAVDVWLKLRDAAATVALGLTGGLWGLLGLALFADGRGGQGWNGIAPAAGDVMPPGVGGVFTGDGQQLAAQLAGLFALGVWGLLWGLLLGVISQPQRLTHLLAKPAVKDEALVPVAEEETASSVPEAEEQNAEKAPAADLDDDELHPVDHR